MSDEGLRAALEELARERDSVSGHTASDYYIRPYELFELLAAHPPTRICGDQCRSFGIDLLCRMPIGHNGEHKDVSGATWALLNGGAS